MLDLNFVRENFDVVQAALANRNFPLDTLNEFAALDIERRRVIGESDGINQLRNAASKEIGALMQSGDRDAAEVKKQRSRASRTNSRRSNRNAMRPKPR